MSLLSFFITTGITYLVLACDPREQKVKCRYHHQQHAFPIIANDQSSPDHALFNGRMFYTASCNAISSLQTGVFFLMKSELFKSVLIV